MTRINVIPVEELADQHLIAEYRELPRCLKQNIDISNAPDIYCLGAGHMRWARKHAKFLLKRYGKLCKEMKYRGFKPGFSQSALIYMAVYWCGCASWLFNDYEPTNLDIVINRSRIVEKYRLKPNWYRWTNRKKPEWLI